MGAGDLGTEEILFLKTWTVNIYNYADYMDDVSVLFPYVGRSASTAWFKVSMQFWSVKG